jgi:hypothetical protein
LFALNVCFTADSCTICFADRPTNLPAWSDHTAALATTFSAAYDRCDPLHFVAKDYTFFIVMFTQL